MLYEFYAKSLLTLPSMTWSGELTNELAAFSLLLCLVGLSNLEARFPKIPHSAKQSRQSYRTNISLFVFNNLLMAVCSVSTLFVVAAKYSGYGPLNEITNPGLKALLAFLAIDLLLYVWHQACHRLDALWMFHRVHHNDPYLNASTAFRLHFVEIFITNALKALLIVMLGIDKMLVLTIETLVTLCIIFHHTNIGFKYERILGCVMVVPFIHRVHHSTERSEHDRNYGAVLSIWDRLFGTYSEAEPNALGIKGKSPMDFLSLIKFGFATESPVVARPDNLDVMIAEAAYYRAEKRHFYPGYEMRDWLEAKKDISNQLYGNKIRTNNSFWQNISDSCHWMFANFKNLQSNLQWH